MQFIGHLSVLLIRQINLQLSLGVLCVLVKPQIYKQVIISKAIKQNVYIANIFLQQESI